MRLVVYVDDLILSARRRSDLDDTIKELFDTSEQGKGFEGGVVQPEKSTDGNGNDWETRDILGMRITSCRARREVRFSMVAAIEK